ncbi:MAG: insulinase family protein [Lachnospiraceae bacterium]|nr:insulinase family protein [Lachnospiraceae bacterium]
MAFTIPEAYELVKKQDLPRIHSVGYILSHKKNGARVVLLENDDNNKVFTIGFRTPPKDSTGVAHIVEHTTLCGSEKYPAKDPFIELAKGSLNTFLNAMTYPDKTIYPVASCNAKDLNNLMSVYMDAVFHPNIYKNKAFFLQEGWRYELTDREAPLTLNGVVYSEMKGAFSAPDEWLSYETSRRLFPNHTYGIESGGLPEAIPDLTYEDFLKFHSVFYHPSNSYICLYGNLDFTERLEYMDREYLSKYDRIFPNSEIPLQQPLAEVVRDNAYYGITREEKIEHNTYLSWARVFPEIKDPVMLSAWDILEDLLLNSSGAYLRDALAKAGIGANCYGGIGTYRRQPTFEVVAQSAETDQRDAFEEVIVSTLKDLVANGIPKRKLQASINSYEFRARELDYGRTPRGLRITINMLSDWLYDDDAPFRAYEDNELFDKLRALAESDYYEKLIETYLLSNDNGIVLALMPKQGLNEERDAALAEKLAAKKATLSDAEMDALIQQTEELKKFQETPSTKEELEMIPMLSKEDIDKKNPPLTYGETTFASRPLGYCTTETNGIVYSNFMFDERYLDLSEIQYLEILSMLLLDLDTENYTYSELNDEIKLVAGGLMTQTWTFGKYRGTEGKTYLRIIFKTLERNLRPTLALIEEVLLRTKFTDERRIHELIARSCAQIESNIQWSGDGFASDRATANLSDIAWYEEMRSGLSYYRFIKDINDHWDEKKDALIEHLQKLYREIFTQNHLKLFITAPDAAPYEAAFAETVAKLPKGDPNETLKDWRPKRDETERGEGFKTAAQIQFVSRAGKYSRDDYPEISDGNLQVLRVIMNYEYLWTKIRVLGGAYGCWFSPSYSGMVYMATYRDPQLRGSDEVFDQAPDYIESIDLSERDELKYIIGAISSFDAPMTALDQGNTAMARMEQGITEELWQRIRDEILATDSAQLRRIAPAIREALSKRYFCVIGNGEAIERDIDLFTSTEQMFS